MVVISFLALAAHAAEPQLPLARPWNASVGGTLIADGPDLTFTGNHDDGILGLGGRVQLSRNLGTPSLRAKVGGELRRDAHMSGYSLWTETGGAADTAIDYCWQSKRVRLAGGLGARFDSTYGPNAFVDLGVDLVVGQRGFLAQIGYQRGVFEHTSLSLFGGWAF